MEHSGYGAPRQAVWLAIDHCKMMSLEIRMQIDNDVDDNEEKIEIN